MIYETILYLPQKLAEFTKKIVFFLQLAETEFSKMFLILTQNKNF